MLEDTNLDEEVVDAYIELVGEEYAEVDSLEESYQGEWESDEDFVQELLESTDDLPENLPSYIHIDWEGTARDIMYDYSEVNGYYFRNL